MDLPVIGAHCALASCRQLDLLPIRCRCDNQFCSAHIFPDNHDCPVDPSYAPSDRPALDKLQRCAVVACTRPSLDGFVSEAQAGVRARCPRCTLGYCASHRDPAQHACPVPVPQAPPKNAAAHALLAKHFPSSAAAPRKAKTKRPTDPAKLAQLRKVELMKMRQRAAPGNPKDPPGAVPADQRVHVVVRTDEPDVGEKTFWFRKTIGAGRALDLLSGHFKLPSSDSQPLQLSKVDADGAPVLVNDIELSQQIEDGCILLLAKVPS